MTPLVGQIPRNPERLADPRLIVAGLSLLQAQVAEGRVAPPA